MLYQLKDLINTRQDLNREINALRRFSKRGNEEIVIIPNTDYNVKTTKWQRTEMNRRVGYINRRRQKRLEEMQPDFFDDLDLTDDDEYNIYDSEYKKLIPVSRTSDSKRKLSDDEWEMKRAI